MLFIRYLVKAVYDYDIKSRGIIKNHPDYRHELKLPRFFSIDFFSVFIVIAGNNLIIAADLILKIYY